MTDIDELRTEINYLFEREPDEDGLAPLEYPGERLGKMYKLDFSYMNSTIWEGSTIHRYTRLCGKDEKDVNALVHNLDMPTKLFEAALRLFGESIPAYHGAKERVGGMRYYPPVILTFWAGFEAFVRYSSQLMLATVRDVPEVAANFLREVELVLDHTTVKRKTRSQSILKRYAVLLKYGYGYEADKGSKWWQRLEKAVELRNYYTHLGMEEARSISSDEVIDYLEAVLLGIIWPSSELQRTLHLGVFHLYDAWLELSKLAEPYTEQPFFKDWPIGAEPHLLHCNFENVDTSRFPNSEEQLAMREQEGPR